MPEKVNLKNLKTFVAKELPRNSALRQLILQQSEELDANVFLARIEDWLKLCDIELGGQS